MPSDSTPHSEPLAVSDREWLKAWANAYIEFRQTGHLIGAAADVLYEFDEDDQAQERLAHVALSLEEQLEAQTDLLRRLRQWDMLVGGIGADGQHHEATADAPYWRNAIDRVLSNPADIPLTPEQIAKAESELQMRAEIHGSAPAISRPAFLERKVGEYPPVMDDLIEEPDPAISPKESA